MTTTPQEPEPDPEVVPAGDPGNAPQSEPDTLPDPADAATGADDAETTLGPGVAD